MLLPRQAGHRPRAAESLRMFVRLLFVLSFCTAFLRGAEEPTLHLLCWSEYVPPSVIESFTRQTGVKVTLANYNSNEQMLAMLAAKPGYYDLIQPSQFYVEKLAAAGGLEPLDLERIPNRKNLDPAFIGLPHDPKGKYSVPWMAGTVGIVVNTERIKEPVETWADVFSGRYSGRIVIVNDRREMVAWALASLGLSVTQIDDANLAKVEPVLQRWLPQVKTFDSDRPHTALLRGDADLGIVWSGEAAILWQQDRRYRYVLPREGAHMFLDSLAIPARAPHRALAEDFMNHCLSPEESVQISDAYPYTNPNLAARKRLTREQLANPASYPPNPGRLLPLRNIGNDAAAVERFVGQVLERIGK